MLSAAKMVESNNDNPSVRSVSKTAFNLYATTGLIHPKRGLHTRSITDSSFNFLRPCISSSTKTATEAESAIREYWSQIDVERLRPFIKHQRESSIKSFNHTSEHHSGLKDHLKDSLHVKTAHTRVRSAI